MVSTVKLRFGSILDFILDIMLHDLRGMQSWKRFLFRFISFYHHDSYHHSAPPTLCLKPVKWIMIMILIKEWSVETKNIVLENWQLNLYLYSLIEILKNKIKMYNFCHFYLCKTVQKIIKIKFMTSSVLSVPPFWLHNNVLFVSMVLHRRIQTT